MECISEGWRLIKDQYWLFLGITVVGVLIAGLVPFGILAGPMMCGIYYCLFRQFRGRPVKFEMLFKGFDDFAQSLIATLIMVGVMLAIFLPVYILFFVGLFANMPKPAPGGPGAGPPPSPGAGLFATIGLFYLAILVIVIVVQIFFFFVYPLITERKLTGVQAITTSCRAGMGNFGGVLGLLLLITLLQLAGSLACCIGQFFVMPIHYAAVAVAYRRVFESDMPEPPLVQDYGDPDVQPLPPERGRD